VSNPRSDHSMHPRLEYALILAACIVAVGISIYLSQPFVLPLSLGFLAAAVGIIGFRTGRTPALRATLFNYGVVACVVILIVVRFVGSRDTPSTFASWPYFLQLIGSAWGIWCVYHLVASSMERRDEP
jgi:hypothetical protein